MSRACLGLTQGMPRVGLGFDLGIYKTSIGLALGFADRAHIGCGGVAAGVLPVR